MRYKILTLALLLALPFTLTACTLQDLPVIGKYFPAAETPPASSSSITMWGLWENPEVMNTLISNYTTAHPGSTVSYDDRSILNLADYKERVVTRAGAGLEADVILVHNSWVPSLSDSLSPMPSSVMSPTEYSQAFYPVASQSAVINGNVYAVPFYYDGLVMVYNKKHFSEIGQTEPPTAWEEFRRLALKLTIRTGSGGSSTLVRSGAAIGTADNIDNFSDIIGLMFSQTNVKIPQDLDNNAARDALDYYTTFSKVDKIWDNSMPEAVTAFTQEKVSMIFVPSWRLLDILAANPTLDLGVAPVPQAVPDSPASWASFWMLAVPKSSQNASAAWEFIKYLSSEDGELALFNEATKFRPYGAPYARVSLASQLESNPYLQPVVATAPFAWSGEIAAKSGNDKFTEPLKKVVDSVLTGKSTAAQALKDFKEGKIQ